MKDEVQNVDVDNVNEIQLQDSGDEVQKKKSGGTVTVAVLSTLIAVAFLLVAGSQLRRTFDDSLQTDTAFFHEGEDSLLFQAVYIRNERVVESEEFAQISRSGSGVVSYTNRCGSKLSNNSVVAVVYPSEQEKYTRQRISELRRKVELLSEAEAFVEGGASDSLQIDAFSSQAADVHLRMLRSISAGDYEAAVEYSDRYLALQTKINLLRATITIDELKSTIASLNAQITSLESGLSRGALRQLTVKEAGYFVSNADGYEEVLNFANTRDITREEIEQVIANPSLAVADNAVGKMVDGYVWRMAAAVPSNRIVNISRGATVEVRIGAFPHAVSVKVVSVTDNGDGTSVIVFESEILNEEFVRQRVTGVRLMLGTYSGLRIPQSAIVFHKEEGEEEGHMGVYVRNGSVLEFRRVTMLRSDENYVIVENVNQSGFLRMFDEIVVGGTNLYDGKIV